MEGAAIMRRKLLSFCLGACIALNLLCSDNISLAEEIPREPIIDSEETLLNSKSEVDNDTTNNLIKVDEANKLLGEDLPETTPTEDNGQDADEYFIVDKVTIKNGDKELTAGDSISFNDKLSVVYSFKSNIYIGDENTKSELGDENAIVVAAGGSYSMPKLDGVGISFSGSTTPVTMKDGTSLGSITITSDRKVTFTFDSNLENGTQLVNISDFVVSFSLDQNIIGNAEEYTLNILGNTYAIKLSDNVKEAPSVTTSGEQVNGTDTVQWTNTIKNANNPKEYANGYTFVGTLGEGQVINEKSIKVGDKEKSAKITLDDNGVIQVVVALTADEISKLPNGETKITYTTTVDYLADGGAAKANNSKTVTNKAAIETADPASTIAESEASSCATTTTKAIASLSKALNDTDGKFTKIDGDKGKGSWTITVNTNGYAVQNLKIYDYLNAGDTDSTLSLDESTLKVTMNGNVLTKDTDYKLVYNPSEKDSEDYTWYISIPSAPANTEFEVTYNTLLSNYTHYLRTNHIKVPSNKAFMTYEYEKGNGTWNKVIGPSMTVNSKLTTNAGIAVTATSYNPSTHEITWTVAVNREKQGLTNAIVVDNIPGNQTYVSSDFTQKVTGGNEKRDGNKITYTIGNTANENTITFNVVTKLTNDEVNTWSKNQKENKYENPFTLSATELPDNGLTVTGSCTCPSNVIELKASDYDYATHEIQYTVDVNNNKMPMEKIKVADNLGSLGLELVPDSVKINDTAIVADENAANYYTYKDGTLTVYPATVSESEAGQNTAEKTITFKVKVTDEKLKESTANTEDVTITNTATLKTQDLTEGEASQANTKFTNTAILKDAVIDEGNFSASYVVTFNANQLVLPTNLKVEDTFGTSLDLDVNSVKLFVGQVDSKTGAITSTGTLEEGYKVSTAVNEKGQTVLTITLPQRENNTSPYYLTYSASVSDFSVNDYDNSVALIGYANKTYTTVNVKAQALASCSATASKAARLEIVNTDADDNNVALSQSTFNVIDTKENIVRTLVTKSNGKVAALGGKLKNGETYTIQQTSVKDGYVLNENKYTVTIKDNKGLANITNKKQSKVININKTDGLGSYVENAKLEISWVNSKGEIIKAASWTTTGETYSFDASYDVVYTLKETEVPAKYKKAANIIFKVVDGNLYVKNSETGEFALCENIEMVDVPKAAAEVTIGNISKGQNNQLEGSKIALYTSDNVLVTNWTSTGLAKTVALTEGEYYIKEEEAPKGYTKANPLAFKIDGKGDVLVKENAEYKAIDESGLTLKSDYNDNELATVAFSPETLGINSDLFASMKFVLYTFDLSTNQLVAVEPTSVDETTGELIYNLHYQDEYVIKPEGEIKGFDPVAPMSIKVMPKLEKESTSNETNGEANGTDTIYVADANGIYTSKELITIGEELTPKATPKQSYGDDSDSKSYYGSKAQPTETLKDKDFVYTDSGVNAINQKDGKNRLAKTGGFLGTVVSYLLSFAMILTGLYMVLGKKRNEI